MAQQWVALIFSGPSGIQVPCTILPTLSFHQQTALCLAADCQVKWATCTRCHTKHIWLAPSGLVRLPWVGRKYRWVRLMSLTFCNGTRGEMWQAAAELKYQGYSESLLMWFFCLFTILSRITVWLYTLPLSRDSSDVEAVRKASGYSACTRTCVVQMHIHTQMTSKCLLHFSMINNIMQQFLREVLRKKKQSEPWKRKNREVCP